MYLVLFLQIKAVVVAVGTVGNSERSLRRVFQALVGKWENMQLVFPLFHKRGSFHSFPLHLARGVVGRPDGQESDCANSAQVTSQLRAFCLDDCDRFPDVYMSHAMGDLEPALVQT